MSLYRTGDMLENPVDISTYDDEDKLHCTGTKLKKLLTFAIMYKKFNNGLSEQLLVAQSIKTSCNFLRKQLLHYIESPFYESHCMLLCCCH